MLHGRKMSSCQLSVAQPSRLQMCHVAYLEQVSMVTLSLQSNSHPFTSYLIKHFSSSDHYHADIVF